MTNDCISIEKDGEIREEKVLVKRFNENYINIVKISSGNQPSSLGNCEDSAQDYRHSAHRCQSAHRSLHANAKENLDYQITKCKLEFPLSLLKCRPILLIAILQILSLQIFLIIIVLKTANVRPIF